MLADAPLPPLNGRFTEKLRSIQNSSSANGLWNPDPALVQWAASLPDVKLSKKHAPEMLIHKALSNGTFVPQKSDWQWGEHHWPAYFYTLAPTAIVDLCGGITGITKWGELSPSCGAWVVNNLKCMQGCNTAHRFSGFGACMQKCAGIPNPAWCSEAPGNEKIFKHCTAFMNRWDICKVSKNAWPDSDSWFGAINNCVYNCETALETEMSMGQSLDWRGKKCNLKYYSCGTFADPFMCHTTEPLLCGYPLGQGSDVCWVDDPWCGDKHWGCYPQPAEGLTTKEFTNPGPNNTVTTVVSMFNESGGFVMNATMPRLPYVRPEAPPLWYRLVRPTPFAPKPTSAPTTPIPVCQINVTKFQDGKKVGMITVNGTWNGSACINTTKIDLPKELKGKSALLRSSVHRQNIAQPYTSAPTEPPAAMRGAADHDVPPQPLSFAQRMRGVLGAMLRPHAPADE